MNTANAIAKLNPVATPSADKTPCTSHGLTTPVILPFQLPTPVYGAMLAIWHLRPLLQRRFPLHKGKPEDYLRFLAWCAIEGRKQYKILRSIPEWDEALSHPISLPVIKKDKWVSGYSVAMFFYGLARYRYFLSPILKQRLARHRVARSYWRGERHKHELQMIADWHVKWLEKTYGMPSQFLEALRIRDRDGERTNETFRDEFELGDLISPNLEFIKTHNTSTTTESPGNTTDLPCLLDRSNFSFPLSIRGLKKVSKIRERFTPNPAQFELSSVTNRAATGSTRGEYSKYPFGVNLFGYAQGEIGIGEDVRLVSRALEAQGIPFCIINVKPGDNVSQKDSSVNHWLIDEPKYSINLFCTTGIEQIRYGCEQGLDVFKDRYNIGFWPWELPDWPSSCNYVYSIADEIWGISHYTATAYRGSQRPVVPMTLPVTINSISDLGREHFKLPQNRYLFVFSFDFNSTLSRKNPKAVIESFLRAFPALNREKVGLVVKASHVDNENSHWKAIEKLAQSDSRIYIINQTLRKPEVLALYRCCDCYVSLHRAEGFGRGLAEALLLDMQLITTAFSGNMDFCHEDRVALVNYKMTEVEPGSYFHADGQFWASPDINHAAQLMKEIFQSPKHISASKHDFSPTFVGKRYAKRLHEIKNETHQR